MCVGCVAQTPTFQSRSNGSFTAVDYRLAARYNFYLAYNLTDTSLNGGLDTLGAMIHVRSGALQGVWYRDSVSTGGHQWIQLSRANQNYWTLNSTSLYPNSTSYNVGIGTTSPTHKLDVVSGTGLLFFDGTRLGLYSDATKNNVLVGQLTGQSLSTTYTDAIFIGGSAGRFATGNYNIAIGTSTLQNVDNSDNTAIGYKSLYLTDSTDNTALGYLSGLQNYGTSNTSIGSQSGNFQTLGSGAVNNSEIVTSSAAITGTTAANLITAQSLSVGAKYAALIHFNGTPPEPYNASGITDLYSVVTVTASNTLTLYNAANFTTQGTSTMTITIFTKQNNSIAIGYNARTTASNQIVLGNTSSTLFNIGDGSKLSFDNVTVPTTGYILTWDGSKYSPAAGGASSLTFSLPLLNTAGVVSINNATTSTVGAASFFASDFNVSSGAVTLDYVNGQAASTSLKGFLSATDWNTFNSKASAATGAITTFYSSNATASRAIVSDVSGKLAVSATTSTEIGYVSGVTSAIQTQLNAKLGTSLTSGQILVGNGSNIAAGVTMSGDATISNAGVFTLANSGVTAGTYSVTTVTVNAKGIITAIADGSGGGGGTGTVTTVLGTSPIISDGDLVTPTISILNAKADGSTKGAAWFSSNDFNDNGSGGISLDYTNGTAASAINKGYLTSADWTTFNNKVSTTRTISAGTGLTGGGDLSADRTITLNSIAGFIASGSNITITGTGSISSPYTISSTGGGGSGTVTTVSGVNTNGFTWSIATASTTPALTLSLQNAAADGTTKGQSTFTAADFNATTGLISIDYTNGQAATTSLKGFLTSTDWNTFNNKQAAITGAATTIVASNLTASRAVISNALGKIDVSTTTSTDLTNFVLAHTQQNLTDGATITMNCANGYLGKVTLGGNRTLAITNNTNGYDIVIEVIQDGTGARTLTLPSGSIVPVGFGSGTSITLSTTGGAKDIIYGKYDGTNYFWTIAKQFQ